jgi:hypothetical protein
MDCDPTQHNVLLVVNSAVALLSLKHLSDPLGFLLPRSVCSLAGFDLTLQRANAVLRDRYEQARGWCGVRGLGERVVVDIGTEHNG